MIRALIFDCFGVLVVDSVIGAHRDEAMIAFTVSQRSRYKTALLSNISRHGLSQFFDEDALRASFDTTITTYEEQVAKPHPRAFLLVVERLGVAPQEAVMIDDTAGHCTAARAAGLHAIHYRSLAQLRTELAALIESADAE